MLKHHQLIKQTTRRSVVFQVLIVHVGDFSCIKKHTVEVKGAEGKCFFFRSSGVAGIGYFWANYLLQVKFMTKTGYPLVSYS